MATVSVLNMEAESRKASPIVPMEIKSSTPIPG